jgi:hypothetical protein
MTLRGHVVDRGHEATVPALDGIHLPKEVSLFFQQDVDV